MQIFTVSDPDATSLEAYTQLIMDFLGFGQTLCKQTQPCTTGFVKYLPPQISTERASKSPHAARVQNTATPSDLGLNLGQAHSCNIKNTLRNLDSHVNALFHPPV